MVARFVSGKEIDKAVRYNEQKVAAAKAELIGAFDFTKDADRLTMSDKIGQLQYLAKQNCRTRRNAIHISLNFDKADQLDKEKLLEIAQTYMDKIGFTGQPCLIYQHHDAAHTHIHLVTTNIRDGARRININNIGRNQSETARKEIEELFGLVKAQGKKQERDLLLKPVQAEKVIYGKSETKAAVSNTVREVVSTYKFTSLAELNAVLRLSNIEADRGTPGSQMHQKNGLRYFVLNEQGQRVGVPIKASSIYGRPTMANLQKRFAANEQKRKGYQQRLQAALDKALQPTGGLTQKAFTSQLKKAGVDVVWRRNEEGRLYGITYVDHATRSVFNGSDLGKAYSANTINEFLVKQPENDYDRNSDPKDDRLPFIVRDLPGNLISTLLEQPDVSDQMDYHLRITKKKKKKRPNF